MAIKLNIVVADIASTLAAGFTHIKVYRSAKFDTGFTEITIPSSIIALQVGVSNYIFNDETGTTKHWYRTTFFESSTPSESAFSASFQGTFVETRFAPLSYPTEAPFTSDDYFVLDKVRVLIGDQKELTRDFVSISTGFDSISLDEKTHTLSNPKGWPLSITLDGDIITDTGIARINDYQFVTFSGISVSTVSGTLDVWYDHFRHSDIEILKIYNSLTTPPQLTEKQVTFELAAVCTALEILLNELRLAGAVSGTEVDIFQEIRINPRAGLDGRFKDAEALALKKRELIQAILDEAGGINDPNKIQGVLVD
jgi:hypothetical protein